MSHSTHNRSFWGRFLQAPADDLTNSVKALKETSWYNYVQLVILATAEG